MQKNLIILFLMVFITGASSQTSKLCINEFQALNAATIRSVDFFEYSDWIELYNDGDVAINIGNYFLTDNLSDSFKYKIPPYTFIQPKSTLLFWADGEDYIYTGYHTNFSLGESEEIGLFSPTGILLDSVSYPQQITDFTYGRYPDGGEHWVFFDEPTPRKENVFPGALEQTDPPRFSLAAGFYASGQIIEIEALTDSATLYYSDDGSVPTRSSSIYTGPITVNDSKVIRARAYKEGFLAGPVVTHTYIIGQDYGIPVMSLATDPRFLFDEKLGIYVDEDLEARKDWERLVHLQFFDINGNLEFDVDAGMRLFGRTAMYLPQKSLSIFMRGKYGPGKLDYKLFPNLELDEYESFILRSSSDDWELTMFRDAMIHTLISKNFSIDTQAYRPCIMFLNGAFWGIHNIREKYNEYYLASHHNVDADQLDIVFNNLLKGVNSIEVLAGDAEKYNELIQFIQRRDGSAASNYDALHQLLDVDNFIDYCIAEMYSANAAWRHNRKLWRPKTPQGRFQWIFYDLDRGYKLWDRNTLEDMFYSDPVFKWLSDNETFRNDFIGRYASHINISLTPELTLRHIDSLKSSIEAEIPGHLQKWKAIGSVQRWEEKVEEMREFARQRPAFARGDIANLFDLKGTCELEVLYSHRSAGKIFSHGLPVPADSFRGIYYKNVPIQLKAVPNFGYRFSHWQGPETMQGDSITLTIREDTRITAVFESYATELKLVINEIHYHPARVGENNNSYEFIEIYNGGTEPVDLKGTAFTSGIDFVFSGGTVIDADEYIIVAKDSSYYNGQGYQVFQWSDGNLSNGGELLRFEDGNGNCIDSVDYDDDSPWPTEPDGAGPSLALKDPYLNNSQADNWTAGRINGSPGQANSSAILDLSPVIHFLKREPKSPTSSSTIQVIAKVEDDHAVSRCTLHFNAGLGPNQLVMYDDGMHGDVAPLDSIYGASFPPLANSTVVEYYVSAVDDAGQRTLYPNTAPDIPALFKVENDTSGQNDIVVSEIMYHSTGVDTEWVEICNRGTTVQDLGFWIFRDDSDSHFYRFPASVNLSAGECLVLCADTTAVKLRYDIDNVIGNFDFGLSNGNDQIRLFNANQILIDSVAYADESPWPAATDGEGYSLDLSDLYSDNNQAVNWKPSADIGGSPGTRSGYTLLISSQPRQGGTTRPTEGSHLFERNAVIEISAVAANGYHFLNWKGSVMNPDSIITPVRMDSHKTVIAYFEPDTFRLTVNVLPEAGGEVLIEPDKTVYQYGDTVWVQANAAENYIFSHWKGLADSLTRRQKFVMNQDFSLRAHFVRDITSAPTLAFIYPSAGALHVPENPVIRFQIGEPERGIERDSLRCYINNKPFINGGIALDTTLTNIFCANKRCDISTRVKGLSSVDSISVRIIAANQDIIPDKLDTLISYRYGQCRVDSLYSDMLYTGKKVSPDSLIEMFSTNIPATDSLQLYIGRASCEDFIPDSLEALGSIFYMDPFGYQFDFDLTFDVNIDSSMRKEKKIRDIVLLFLSAHQQELQLLMPVENEKEITRFRVNELGYVAVAFHPAETLSAFMMPQGQTDPLVEKSYTYYSNQVFSSYGHPVQYRFDWGDGQMSSWSADTLAAHQWQESGSYQVRVLARCQIDTNLIVHSKPLVVEVQYPAAVEIEEAIPEHFELLPNYPNPFNPTTRIEYKIPKSGHVNISVYNVLGQKIATLVNEEKSPGHYILEWNGLDDSDSPVSANVYFLILKSAEYCKMFKMFFCK